VFYVKQCNEVKKKNKKIVNLQLYIINYYTRTVNLRAYWMELKTIYKTMKYYYK